MANFPVQNPNPDITTVKRLCEDYVKARLRGQLSMGSSDFVFCKLMEALYGEGIFSRIDAVAQPQKAK
jgi:hypothetical protein